jgi:BASS family bile acid:Na+ symporter
MMVIIGFELSIADFRHTARYPLTIIAGTLAQILLLPLLAALFIWLVQPPAYIAAGLIVLSACPGGALSNFYTFLAGANVALSVTLTAVSTLCSLLALPLIITLGFAWLLERDTALQLPLLSLIARLSLMLLVPIAAGMFIRARWPGTVQRYVLTLRRCGIFALLLLIALVLYDQGDKLAEGALSTIAIAILFVCLTLVMGYGLGLLLRLTGSDCFALAIEFSIRNMGVAALVAVTLLGNTEFIVFGAVYFVTEIPLILLAVLGFRRSRQARRGLRVPGRFLHADVSRAAYRGVRLAGGLARRTRGSDGGRAVDDCVRGHADHRRRVGEALSTDVVHRTGHRRLAVRRQHRSAAGCRVERGA